MRGPLRTLLNLMCVATQITGSGCIGAGNNALKARETRKSRLLLPLSDHAVYGLAPSVIEAAPEGLIMCGRFTLTADLTLLAERFHFDPAALSYTPSYNIAPSQQILTVMNDGTSNGAGVPPLGPGALLGQRSQHWSPHDQCASGNRSRETELSAGFAAATLSGTR